MYPFKGGLIEPCRGIHMGPLSNEQVAKTSLKNKRLSPALPNEFPKVISF